MPPQATPAKRRILIVDAHPLLRRGLAALIDNESDLSVCAEAETEPAALHAIAADGVDLVVAGLWPTASVSVSAWRGKSAGAIRVCRCS